MKALKKAIPICLAAILLTVSTTAQEKGKAIHGEKFKPTDESLTQYHYPEWFRDAKLGFWSHRG